ncbi:hypothetical protein D3C77_501130 [compost metagenome]
MISCSCLSSSSTLKAIAKLKSFSRTPDMLVAPGSLPPWPASITIRLLPSGLAGINGTVGSKVKSIKVKLFSFVTTNSLLSFKSMTILIVDGSLLNKE